MISSAYFKIAFELIKGVLAYIMLNAASLLLGGILIHAHAHKQLFEEQVALVDLLRCLQAGFGEHEAAVILNREKAAVSELGNGVADAWL